MRLNNAISTILFLALSGTAHAQKTVGDYYITTKPILTTTVCVTGTVQGATEAFGRITSATRAVSYDTGVKVQQGDLIVSTFRAMGKNAARRSLLTLDRPHPAGTSTVSPTIVADGRWASLELDNIYLGGYSQINETQARQSSHSGSLEITASPDFVVSVTIEVYRK